MRIPVLCCHFSLLRTLTLSISSCALHCPLSLASPYLLPSIHQVLSPPLPNDSMPSPPSVTKISASVLVLVLHPLDYTAKLPLLVSPSPIHLLHCLNYKLGHITPLLKTLPCLSITYWVKPILLVCFSCTFCPPSWEPCASFLSCKLTCRRCWRCCVLSSLCFYTTHLPIAFPPPAWLPAPKPVGLSACIASPNLYLLLGEELGGLPLCSSNSIYITLSCVYHFIMKLLVCLTASFI